MARKTVKRACSVQGCAGEHAAKGYCRKHYMRLWKNGTLELQNQPQPIKERYAADPSTGCWNWLRGKDKDGYGKLQVGSRHVRAHRHLWEIANGPIPAGLLLCHKCDNPSCVNPDHLFLGDHAVNHRDRGQKGRTARGERAGAAKLTAAAVAEIRATRPGEREAAERYGIRRSQYYRILRGASWGDANV